MESNLFLNGYILNEKGLNSSVLNWDFQQLDFEKKKKIKIQISIHGFQVDIEKK
jgi:hypothetical protein